MRILVVCGAGASSTFVAQRIRSAAEAAGREVTAAAGTETSIAAGVADVILLGPHLAAALARIRDEARGTTVALLPPDVFADRDGTRTLALIDALSATASPPSTERNPA
ncbi:PTS sugar transporter subunit IIB [Microbacterium sp.]|uniref:PTS sugar transporter subunit IIB n=1 Tax=Microbacterium sp. TaxID=51671 RepID=UPI0039E6C535